MMCPRIVQPLLCLLLLPAPLSAQGVIEYTYDGAGNQVRREAAQTGRKAAKRQTAASEERMATGLFHGLTVKVSPNPTEGPLRVCLSGLRATDRCSLAVYMPQGELVLCEEARADVMNIDLSSRPSGVYLLNINLNDESDTWKIIKK